MPLSVTGKENRLRSKRPDPQLPTFCTDLAITITDLENYVKGNPRKKENHGNNNLPAKLAIVSVILSLLNNQAKVEFFGKLKAKGFEVEQSVTSDTSPPPIW